VNDATVGRCESVLVLSVLVMCKHLFYNELWLIIGFALALSDCACDMDQESVINELSL